MTAAELAVVDVEARRRAPEVPPPPRKHAGLHNLPRHEEGHDGVEELVGEGAPPVAAAVGGSDALAGGLVGHLSLARARALFGGGVASKAGRLDGGCVKIQEVLEVWGDLINSGGGWKSEWDDDDDRCVKIQSN